MKRASVVIGAAFGDEGKGLLTDFFAAQSPNSIVVRFNGGAQAGHTVVTNDQRHVFSHFGSGSLAGAATYLSQFFISNPFVYRDEGRSLHGLDNAPPRVFAHPEGLLSTPFDMLINQARDRALKHGSCGLGINETVVRNTSTGKMFNTNMFYINQQSLLASKLKLIRDVWVPMRFQQIGIQPDTETMQMIQSPHMILDYLDAVEYMRKHTILKGPECLESRDVVFEGAQGLLLDEEHHFFPHVTRSKTGMDNVRLIAKEADITEFEVAYVTRAYTTRHGDGPFPSQNDDLSFHDDTNVKNDWQGTIRFGHLDLDLIGEAIQKDRVPKTNGSACLVVTHMDQMKELSCVIGGHLYENLSMQTFFDYCRIATGIARIGFSVGPTRNDVTMVD